jgi:hypothetical protein
LCWSIWKLRNSVCFQGDAWVSLKILWWRLIPMLRCWKILVPLHLMDGYDLVVTTVEKMGMQREAICQLQ